MLDVRSFRAGYDRSVAGIGARRALIAAGVGVVVAAALVGAGSTIDPAAFWQALTAADPLWVALSCGGYLVAQVLSGAVWGRTLVAALGKPVAAGAVQRAHWLARGAAEFLPVPLADAVRVTALRRLPAVRGRTAAVVGSIAGFRLIDGLVGLAVALAAALALPLPERLAVLRPAAGAGLLLCAVAAVALVLWRRRLAHLEGGSRWRVIAELLAGVRVLEGRANVARVVALQLAVTAARIASVAALCIAFDFPAEAAAVAYLAATVASLVALTPGGIGVRELALVPLLVEGHGASAERALALSLSLQGTGMVLSLAGAAMVAVIVPAPRAGGDHDGDTLEDTN